MTYGPERIRAVLDALAGGLNPRAAARLNGASRSVTYKWHHKVGGVYRPSGTTYSARYIGRADRYEMVRLIESGLHDNPQDRSRLRRRDAVIWSSDVTAKVSSTVDRFAMRRHPGRARGSRAARGRHMQETVMKSFSRLPQHIGIIPDGIEGGLSTRD
jgi:transposase-like protein